MQRKKRVFLVVFNHKAVDWDLDEKFYNIFLEKCAFQHPTKSKHNIFFGMRVSQKIMFQQNFFEVDLGFGFLVPEEPE